VLQEITQPCNRTFVENRKYVEVLAAVDTPWQGDFWRQEGLTESQKGGSRKVGRRHWKWRTISFTSTDHL